MIENFIEDLKNLEYKKIDYEEESIDLYSVFSKMQNDIKNIGKSNKKCSISMDSIADEIENKNNEIFKLKKDLSQSQQANIKIYKKILLILDQIESIYEYLKQSNNEQLMNSLEMVQKIINKEILEIGLTEIKSMGELFNAKVHKCVSTVCDENKQYNEIVSVIEKGYILNGEVLRPASVIVVK